MKRNNKWVWLMLVLMLPLCAWLGVRTYERELGRLPVFSQVQYDSSYVFTDQHAQSFTFSNHAKQLTVANFFFTSCPVICPKMTKQLLRVQKAFESQPNIQLLSFTVDPAHDRPEVLSRYADTYGIRWTLLTGTKPALYKLARNAFRLVATEGDGGPTDFIHSDQLVLVDDRGNIRGYYEGTDADAVDELIHDLKQLQHER
ncbi:SCO family protein [Chitinophaga horti]|uniref:SCO family protein n=1 Tax=Chitinophaga horti TaxID=2920382 RepID=A0ABY6IXG0_9BACT|nr:SCO family protein [Chitinophaga horti]UYQ91891.1 SCO family protein [Chitinophaga horti]